MTACKNKIIFSLIVSFCFLFSSSSRAADLNYNSNLHGTKAHVDKEYFLILLGFVFYLPEIVQFSLTDNGTFSLSSDLFTEPVSGTYENNVLLMKAKGTTGKFIDAEWDNIEM